MSIFTKLSFIVYLLLHCNISNFNDSFPLIYKSLMMKNGQTYPFVIQLKLCIIFSCNNQGIATLVCTQRGLTIAFGLSNNTCEGVHLVMDLIGMNFFLGRPNNFVMFLDWQLLWQITCLNFPSFIAFHTSRGRRYLGLPSDPLIVPLVQTMILIVLTM